MTDKIKPCRCGFSGELEGVNNGIWLRLSCPTCKAQVEAFTVRGLIDAWNEEMAEVPRDD